MSAPAGLPWRAAPGGVLVVIRLTPRGGRDAIDGLETIADGKTVVKARVSASPSDGEANAALCQLFARSLRVPGSRVFVAAGATSRVKTLRVEGDPVELSAKLASLCAT